MLKMIQRNMLSDNPLTNDREQFSPSIANIIVIMITLYDLLPLSLSLLWFLILPIIPSRNSHNFYPLFLFYSHDINYYSCYIL